MFPQSRSLNLYSNADKPMLKMDHDTVITLSETLSYMKTKSAVDG